MILGYARELAGPGVAIVLGLYIIAKRAPQDSKPDALGQIMSQFTEVKNELRDLNTRVSRIEGRLEK